MDSQPQPIHHQPPAGPTPVQVRTTPAPRLKPAAVPGNDHPKERNAILVGKKETMAYVLAVVTQFNQGNATVHIKARGKSIMKAVDVSQIVKNRFVPTMKIEKVDLWTEELTAEDGHHTKVSAMDIVVSK